MSEFRNHIARYFDKDNVADNATNESTVNKEDPQFNEALADTKDTLQKIDHYFQLKAVDTNAAWSKVDLAISAKKMHVKVWTRKLMQYAAILLFILATAFLVQKTMHQNKQVVSTASNDYTLPEITLPDGSKVILNQGSTITYPQKFKSSRRQVLLQGEAFFSVLAQSGAGFEVKTKNATVRVLGTSFNVMAYDSNETIQVYVKTGKVEVADNQLAQNHKITLLPGEMGTFNSKTFQLDKHSPVQPFPLAWLSNELSFEFTPLSEVIETLEQVFHVRIETAPAVDLGMPITASFNRQQPDYIVEVVTLALDLRFSKKNENTYFIQPETK